MAPLLIQEQRTRLSVFGEMPTISSVAGLPMPDDLSKRIEHHVIARDMCPWHQKEHDDLEPEGETVEEVIDHWLACRALIVDVGLGQLRYALLDREVKHLAEHIDKWLTSKES